MTIANRNERLRCRTLLVCRFLFSCSRPRGRQRFHARLRDHFHRPNRDRTHIHPRPEIPLHVPRFGVRNQSLALVDHVVQPPSHTVSLVAHPFAKQKSGETKAGSYPHFRRLVNASIKSGTNTFHGDSFEFLRNRSQSIVTVNKTEPRSAADAVTVSIPVVRGAV